MARMQHCNTITYFKLREGRRQTIQPQGYGGGGVAYVFNKPSLEGLRRSRGSKLNSVVGC